MKKLLLLLSIISLCSCTSSESVQVSTIGVIPKPQEVSFKKGNFLLDETVTISAPNAFATATNFLENYLSNSHTIKRSANHERNADIKFILDSNQPNEGYILDISEETITITAKTDVGAFYAVQTLRQLLPESMERLNTMPKTKIYVPTLTITDAPTFEYRGMHLDVSRHFFPKEFIKEYISHLAMLKMNTFHWHLTDDQGWRIEIKKYPKLTEHGAYRDETLVGHYNEIPQRFDGKRYGGFYTQEDVKEIVAFAQQHNVTVIPEIELPGHAQAAISAYPELSCTGEQVPVATKWGVFENIYCPKEETFTFLKNVLAEVIPLFPGVYIHIGGDEAPKTQWKNCDHCQQLIKEKDLKDEHGLQRYFITEIETYVNSLGKKIIGWDEILEGGLAPNATVMSWRGTEGAIQAAKEGHDVILTPTSHAYFDYYQDDHPNEPLAIGGYLPLKKVYSFNPISEGIPAHKTHHVLGAQGNIWTEYITTEEQVAYMAFPRMLAMAEVTWSGATKDLETDYDNFLTRLEPFLKRLDALNVNYANHLYDLQGSLLKKDGAVTLELKTPTEGKEIKYSLNDSNEVLYTKPVPISEDSELTANVYKDGNKVGRTFSETIRFHKGMNADISINTVPHPAYGAGGTQALINGVSGSDTRYGDKEWLGFWGDDLEITITFREPTEVSTVTTRFYNANGQWIYAPAAVGIYALDMEHSKGTSAADDEQILDVSLKFIDTELITSLVLKVENFGIIPDGLQGAGNKAWTFIDEIIIE